MQPGLTLADGLNPYAIYTHFQIGVFPRKSAIERKKSATNFRFLQTYSKVLKPSSETLNVQNCHDRLIPLVSF
jgi:hypothetical protein